MSESISVLIVEDQRALRDGLSRLVDGTAGYRVVGSFESMEAALAARLAAEPDVALLDVQLPGMSGIAGVEHLRRRYPKVQVLMLTVYGDNDRVFEAICAGASGYLLKDTPPARLLEAIRELVNGGAPMSPEIARKVVTMFQRVAPPRNTSYHLSPRETQTLRLLADGHSYKTAAAALDVSPDTIRFHIRNIYEKLHVHSKSEAVLKAFRSGLLS
ncbi:MAG TPA: response regulator transcription factor [Vicinamibacterales bacterium]